MFYNWSALQRGVRNNGHTEVSCLISRHARNSPPVDVCLDSEYRAHDCGLDSSQVASFSPVTKLFWILPVFSVRSSILPFYIIKPISYRYLSKKYFLAYMVCTTILLFITVYYVCFIWFIIRFCIWVSLYWNCSYNVIYLISTEVSITNGELATTWIHISTRLNTETIRKY